MRRLMATIIAFPSNTVCLFSKCVTMSRARLRIGMPDNGFQLRPLRFGLLLFGQLFILFEVPVKFFDQSPAFCIHVHFGQTAFIEDPDCRSIIHRIFDVVPVNVNYQRPVVC